MKNLIVTTVFFLISITTILASVSVTHLWKKDSVYVNVVGPDGNNDFKFPSSYNGYTNTLVPYLQGGTQEEIAYKLEKEYAHSLEVNLATITADNDATNHIIILVSVIVTIISVVAIIIFILMLLKI